jgi:hypothetical protein
MSHARRSADRDANRRVRQASGPARHRLPTDPGRRPSPDRFVEHSTILHLYTTVMVEYAAVQCRVRRGYVAGQR